MKGMKKVFRKLGITSGMEGSKKGDGDDLPAFVGDLDLPTGDYPKPPKEKKKKKKKKKKKEGKPPKGGSSHEFVPRPTTPKEKQKMNKIDLQYVTVNDPSSITSTNTEKSIPQIETSSISSMTSIDSSDNPLSFEDMYEVEDCVKLSQLLADMNGMDAKKEKMKFFLNKKEKSNYMKFRIDPNLIWVSVDSVKEGALKSVTGFFRLGLKRINVYVKRYLLKNCSPGMILHMVDTMHHMAFNENVVDVYGCFFFQDSAYVVTEYHEIGTVAYNLQKINSSFQKNENQSVLERVSLLKDVVMCMSDVNNDGYVHRDLTSFNLVITNSGKIKLAGFVHAMKVKEITYENNLQKKVISRYSAPEMFDLVEWDEEYDPRSLDVYSFGIIMWEVLSSKAPFMNINQLSLEATLKFVHENRMRPPIDEISGYPPKLIELTKKCWAFSPKERPSFAEIKKILVELEFKLKPMKEKNEERETNAMSKSMTIRQMLLTPYQEKQYQKLRVSPDSVVSKEILLGKGNVTLRRGLLRVGYKRIPVMIKEVMLNRINATRAAILSEVELTCKIEHENILHCYGLYFEEKICRIVSEFCQMKTLMKHLPKLKKMSLFAKLDIIFQIAKGMNAMHEQGYAHRNLNTGNMLLHYDARDQKKSRPTIKIFDFKTVKKFNDVKENEFVGKPPYIPPELCNLGKLKNPYLIDVYAFGIIMFEVWMGEKVPMTYKVGSIDILEDDNFVAIAQNIHTKKIRPDVSQLKDAPEKLVELMQKCWAHAQKDRPKSFKVIVDMMKKIIKGVQENVQHRELRALEEVNFDLNEQTKELCKKCILDKSYIVEGDVVGKGARGVVKKGFYKFGFGKIEVAIKEILIDGKNTTADSVLKEIILLHECDHVNVMKCYGIYFQENTVSLVLELCENGDLYTFLRNKKRKMKRELKLSILLQIAKGMGYLHERGIVHRDLKTQNCLLGNDKKIKICDFDTAKHEVSIGASLCGTPEYIAPEMFQYSENVEIKLVDVYSYGIMMWEIWMRRMPFESVRTKFIGQPMQLIHKIHQDELRPEKEMMAKRNAPIELIELCTSCWSKNPMHRPQSFKTIVSALKDIKAKVKAERASKNK